MKSRIYFPKRGKQRKLAKIKRSTKPIAKVSERQKERLKEYAKVKRKFLKENPTCFLCETSGWPEFSGQSGKATDVHHRRGRASALLTDVRFFTALCRHHHNWVHQNIDTATRMGLFGPWGKQS